MHAAFHRLDFRRFFIDQICRVDNNGRQHTAARAFGDAFRNIHRLYCFLVLGLSHPDLEPLFRDPDPSPFLLKVLSGLK
jgi:hypothetical protein